MRTPLIVAAMMFASIDAGAQNPTVAQVVANVDALYRNVTTYNASFSQQYFARAYNTTKTDAGTLVVARPNQMSFAYANGNRAVSNGQTLTVYNAQSQQAYVHPVTTTTYAAAVAFLTGNLSSTFTFTMPSTMTFPNGYVLVGTPITPTPAFTTAILYVDAQTSQVRRVLLLDGQQNRNRFDFSSVSVNLPAPPTTFAFTPPSGTTIIP